MNLASLDLNLLVALDALLLEANVSRAATRIGLSQPAASHALQRLRTMLDDPLLVRVGSRMELTPRAQALRAPLTQTLEQVRGLLTTDGFDAARSQRVFHIMMGDIISELLLPMLAIRVGEQAPNVRLNFVPWRSPQTMTAEFSRSLDLIISCLGDAYPGFHRVHLYDDSDALAVRKGHPVGKRLSDPDTFFKARHIAVVGRGQSEDMIDEWLRSKRLTRQVALTIPGYIPALHAASHTDLVAFVPRRLISALAAPLSLMIVDPPIDPGMDKQFMFYPTRAQVDAGSIWLRNLVLETGRALDKPKRKAA
ncbi:MAG: transcriptional regulator [Proteobacteria bacterium SG_bin9]|nr:MAG: transcriptional regulator [Proteobacteria bacterium SG_bin9]